MPSDASMVEMASTLRDSGFDWLLVVPSTGLQALYDSYGAVDRCVYATREEEAIAVASGLRLGGGRPVVVIQQAGVGNAINAVLTLADAYEIPFPIIVFDRGIADPNPVQGVSSAGTTAILQALGCHSLDWDEPDAGDQFRACVTAGARWIFSPLAGSG